MPRETSIRDIFKPNTSLQHTPPKASSDSVSSKRPIGNFPPNEAAVDKATKEQIVGRFKEIKEMLIRNTEIKFVDFEKQIQNISAEIDVLKSENAETKSENKKVMNELKRRLVEVEDRSRRNNLVISGLEESQQEKWEETEIKVNKLFQEKLQVENVDIKRAHRVGKPSSNKPRLVICNF